MRTDLCVCAGLRWVEYNQSISHSSLFLISDYGKAECSVKSFVPQAWCTTLICSQKRKKGKLLSELCKLFLRQCAKLELVQACQETQTSIGQGIHNCSSRNLSLNSPGATSTGSMPCTSSSRIHSAISPTPNCESQSGWMYFLVQALWDMRPLSSPVLTCHVEGAVCRQQKH
eukprot:1151356-Pelagomonas_calceolata.AAC.1